MSFRQALAAASSHPLDPAVLEELARTASQEGEEEQALPRLDRAVEARPTARLWQWKGLLERSLDEHEAALQSFAEAARLDPSDMAIAHARARVAMEAGLDAQALYEHARTLAPRNGVLVIGLAAARAAAGEGARGAAELVEAVARSPLWFEGHQQLAQLVATLGRPGEATASIEAAIAQHPKEAGLWETLLHTQLRRGAYSTLGEIVDRAVAAGIDSPELATFRGIHAAECAPETLPPDLFERAPPTADQALRSWRIRHLLRAGAAERALPYLDQAIASNPTAEVWAYASTAWRLTGDPRREWLEADPALVAVKDLTASLPPLDELAATLRSLHVARGEYLDQSVRGGTQTDGPLLSRIDPAIRRLRAAIVEAAREHLAGLPAHDPDHPTLRHRRDRRIRFAGSWSVRLRSGGRHSNHVHPLGWFSSALYIALPSRRPGESDDSGWFTLGSPDEKLGLDLPPWRKVEPVAGRLVLFPSNMWHGTVPFEDGERLTVAFDVAPPR